MHSLSRLSAIVRLFNFFGLTTFSLAAKTSENPYDVPVEKLFRRSVAGLIQNLAFILMVGCTNYMTLSKLYWERYERKLVLFNLIDIFDVLLGSLVALTILAFHLVRRGVALTLTSRLYKLYVITDRISGTGRKGKSTFHFVALLIAAQLTLSSIGIVTIVVYYDTVVFLLSSMSRHLIIVWFFTLYVLVIRVLLDTFSNLNESLVSLTRISLVQVPNEKQNSGCFLFSTKNLQLLLKVRSLHNSLIDICQEVESFFEVTILACIVYVFVYLIVSLYFILDLVIEGKVIFKAIEYVHLLLWQGAFLVSLLALTRHVTKTEIEINRTGHIVHQLMRNTLNNEITKELNDFSFYLLHTRVKFTAWGIFSLDGSLIQSIFSSITTYLVILLQFQLQPSSKETLNNNTKIIDNH